MIRSTHAVDALELSTLVESVTDYAISALDPTGRIIIWNVGAQRIKGYSPEEIIGEHFSRFYPPEEAVAGRPEQLLAIAAREGRVRDEGWRVRKDGTRFWADVVITALRDGEGQVRGFLKVTRDLTERRATQELLRQSEERLRLLVEHVEDHAIFMLDPEGRVATWNVGAQRIKGYTPEEIIGEHVSRFYPPDDVAAGAPRRALERAAARGKVEDEGWRVRKDGSRFWADVVITALRDERGVLRGFAKVTRDMTERRRAEQELAARARQQGAVASLGLFALEADDLQRVLDRAADVVATTLDVDVASVSEPAARGLVLRAGHGLGEEGAAFAASSTVAAASTSGSPVVVADVRSDARFGDPALAARGVVSSLAIPVPVPGPGAGPFAVLAAHHRAARAFSSDDVLFVQAVANVIGAAVMRRRAELERLKAERQARAAEERRAAAEQAIQERDVYVSIVAHELRTPVAALALKLSGLGRLVRADGPRLAEVLPERLEGAIRQTQRLALLVERVLDVSRIASGVLRLQREDVDLVALARDVVQDLREPARYGRVSVALVGPDALVGAWDRARVQQVLTNLLDNAIKYGAGHPVDVTIEGDAVTARVRVTDRGPGIAPEDQERVFQRFQRAAPASHHGGMGLGLYVSQQLALAHGGDITLTSAPGQGSTFELRLARRAEGGA